MTLVGCQAEGVEEIDDVSQPGTAGIDLQISSVGEPLVTQVAIGTSLTVSATTTNNGASAAGASKTRFVLSTEPTFGGGINRILGTVDIGALSGGTGQAVTQDFLVPANTADGSYFIIACADFQNAVIEAFETNNCLTSTTTVDVRSPDLLVTNMSEPPATSDINLSFAMTDTTTNNGTIAAPVASATRYFLSIDTVRDGSDRLLGGGQHNVGPLAIGEGSTDTITVTVPGSTPPGVYFVLGCADRQNTVKESNESNNCFASANTIIIGAVPTPDLAITAVSDPPSSVSVANASFDLDDTTSNLGTADAGASTTRFFASTDNTFSIDDVALTGDRVVSVAAGNSSLGTTTVTMPSLPFGTYFIVACADALGVVAESNESNNCLAATGTITVNPPPQPDLVVSAVSDPPAVVTPGQTFNVDDTTENVGQATSVGSTTAFYFSTDAVLGVDDTAAGSRPVGPLAGPGSSTGTTLLDTTGLPFGTYFVIACADDDLDNSESNESNNCTSSTGTFTISSPTDLVEDSVTFVGTTVAPGATLSVTDVARNAGGDPAGAFIIKTFLSLDQVKNGGDRALDGNRGVAGLAGGATDQGTRAIKIPANMPPGNYFVISCADHANVVAELSESNNCVTSATTINVAP